MKPIALLLGLTLSAFAEPGLTKQEAEATRDKLAAEALAKLKTERTPEIEAKELKIGDKSLKWLEKDFGKGPDGKYSLWISMHGGGSGPAQMNDQQWHNQIRLYQLDEGIYVAPRAPTDAWNMWHEAHMDGLFDRLIIDMIACRNVDPNRIYLTGYSAGGDGVWQLAPRMADRFAAAAMMAGHPNDASLLGLRNLPFTIWCGGADAAFNRNKICADKGAELDALQKEDPQGYEHTTHILEGLPHWMNSRDAEAMPWMAKHTRNPWPKRIVWMQDDVTHDRFYWIHVPPAEAKQGKKIVAEVKGNDITLEGDVPAGTSLDLTDALVDFDQPVSVKVNGKEAFHGKVERSAATIKEGIDELPDASRCPFAKVKL